MFFYPHWSTIPKTHPVRFKPRGDVPKNQERGYYFEHTVVSDVSQKAELMQTEVFGAVLLISTVDSEPRYDKIGVKEKESITNGCSLCLERLC